jgi:diguanylate cyclase (GGDEF)-like protein/PAS domain S-box-containing protein
LHKLLRRVRRAFGHTRAQLLVVFAAATLLPLIITLVQLQDERARAEQRASDAAVQTARLSAGQLDDLLGDGRAIAHAVEDTPRFWTLDDEGHDAFLAELAQAQPNVDGVTFLAPDLQEHGASYHTPDMPRLNAASRSYVREAVATDRLSVTSEALHALNDGTVILPIAIPVHQAGQSQLSGLLVVAVKVESLPEVWAHVPLDEGSTIMLVDVREGSVLTGSGDGLQLVGRTISEQNLPKLRSGNSVGWITAALHDGQMRLRASYAIDATPWSVVVDVPESAVYSRAEIDARTRLLSALAICGVTFVALGLFWRRLSREFGVLQQSAWQWARANWTHRARLDGDDELAQLGRAFDTMASELQRAVEHARAEEQRYRELLEQASDGIFVSDANYRYVEVNARACDLTGYSRDELLTMGPRDLVTGPSVASLSVIAGELLGNGRSLHEQRMRRKDSSEIDIEVSAVVLSTGHVQAIVRDVSARKEAERRLAYQARHDALTGLANRTLLRERLRHGFDELRNAPGSAFALLLIDLDRFKEINDTLGHDAGDAVLVEISRRLMAIIPSTDTVARLGGDEFAILLRGDVDNAPLIAQRIVDVVSMPLTVGHDEVAVGASIGIALAPQDAADAVSLMRCADIAMYTAKRGALGYTTFSAPFGDDLAA